MFWLVVRVPCYLAAPSFPSLIFSITLACALCSLVKLPHIFLLPTHLVFLFWDVCKCLRFSWYIFCQFCFPAWSFAFNLSKLSPFLVPLLPGDASGLLHPIWVRCLSPVPTMTRHSPHHSTSHLVLCVTLAGLGPGLGLHFTYLCVPCVWLQTACGRLHTCLCLFNNEWSFCTIPYLFYT